MGEVTRFENYLAVEGDFSTARVTKLVN